LWQPGSARDTILCIPSHKEIRVRNLPTIFIPILIAAIGFTQLARNPRFAAFHTVDALQLLGCGACFGMALMATLGRLKPRNSEAAKESDRS
jgi:glycopeptide antibiotics resistance protein